MVSARENRNNRCHSSISPAFVNSVDVPMISIANSPRSRCQLAHNSFDTLSWPGRSSSMVASA
ncbi:Uncharacterised protein [Mycobacteroides abscessus subsp. abscessus]|nr:Uncharacterised protein [Mycobacteroides abscessus subsp. abscessus]SKV90255.1 Uncharacterised protein [Mycobacteroides abscessus subsp. abscessus]